jgi:hypothetical protein
LFGGDAGYNYQPKDAAPCKTAPTAGDYTAKYPKATYTPGQRVCMAWPTKNHVAATCDNPNIGDAGTKIYRSAKNPTADPTLTEFHQNLVHDFGTNTGTQGIGFQNCPDFCANRDKAMCTGCFEIPKNMELGKYTFLWEWAFNGPNDLYTNCFDVEIVPNTGNYITATYKKVTPDQYAALKASGGADTPTINDKISYDPNAIEGGSGSGAGGSGMSAAGSAVLAIFIIAIVGAAVGSFLFVKLGYGTIDSKFPFYHRTRHDAHSYAAYTGN